MRTLRLVLAICTAVATALITVPAAARAAEPVRDGLIAFGAFDGVWDIYTVRPDGSQLRRLHFTGNPAGGLNPGFSPDGRQIALGTASNSGQIWTMDADGSHQRQLFHDPGYNDDNPRYLPNGDLAFVRCSLSIEGCAIATVHNDGTGVRMLTPMRDGVIDYWMDTSSTGRIAFTRFLAGGVFAQLYVITPGQRPVPVTPAWLGTYKPGWSPDGEHIVFSDCCDANTNLYSIAADGTELRKLTRVPYPYRDDTPAYSPTGTRIVFASTVGHPDLCCRDLWVMRHDATHAVRIVSDLARVYGVVWGPAVAG